MLKWLIAPFTWMAKYTKTHFIAWHVSSIWTSVHLFALTLAWPEWAQSVGEWFKYVWSWLGSAESLDTLFTTAKEICLELFNSS